VQNTEVAAWSIQAALELPSCIPVPLDLCGSRLMDRATCCPHGAVLCFHNIFGSTIGNMCIALKRLPKNFKRGKKKSLKRKELQKFNTYSSFVCSLVLRNERGVSHQDIWQTSAFSLSMTLILNSI